MIEAQQIKAKLMERLSDVKEVGSGIYRGTRKFGNSPISYYYFDTNDDITTPALNLKSYQDNILTNQYFAEPGEIQWSYYLVFLLSAETFEDVKDKPEFSVIEKDKSYTRKFILPEERLADFLDVPVLQLDNSELPTSDLATRWMERLDQSSLSGIATRKARTEVIRNYLDGVTIEGLAPVAESDTSTEPDMVGRGLAAIELKRYRPFPLVREYEFGSMNLFVGANGVGKTSLLEAIELIYAGATLRSEGKVDADVDLHYKFKGDLRFQSYESKANKKYQLRDLRWYGRSVTKGNDLYTSFNRYNFYNADSAYKLANDDDGFEIDKAFSALALGERANFLDTRLKDFQSDFGEKLSNLEKQLTFANQSLLSSKEKLERLESVERPSEKIFATFLEGLKSLIFKTKLPATLDQLDESFSSVLIKLRNDLLQISSRSKSYKSLREMQTRQKELQAVKNETDKLDLGINKLRKEHLDITNEKKKLTTTLDLLARYRPYLEHDFKNKHNKILSDLENHKLKLTIVSRVLDLRAEITEEDLHLFNLKDQVDFVLKDTQEKFDEKRTELLASQQRLGIEKQKFAATQTLLSELRMVAGKFIHEHPDAEDCPVCSNKYAIGELAKRINQAVTKDSGSHIIKAELIVENIDRDLKNLSYKLQIAKKINDLWSFSKVHINFTNNQISTVLDSIQWQYQEKSSLENLIRSSNAELSSFTTLGLSDKGFASIGSQLGEFLAVDSLENSDKIKEETTNKLSVLQQDESLKMKDISDVTEKRSNLLITSLKLQSNALPSAELELKNLIAELAYLENLVNSAGKIISIVDSDDLNQLAMNVEGCFLQMTGVLDARTKEKSNEIELEAARKEVLDFTSKVEMDTASRDKVKTAYDLISDILEKDGKDMALKTFVEKNRLRIDGIFSRIHAPHEFEGLVAGTTSLKRKGASEPTQLNEVSTGQRSALAIAIFLALNLSLTNAPPVILIDDPVAHVDDLNTLSFLDFLRELIVKGERQIFFATANQKLANLIEKKFGFLGKVEFKRFNLSRT